MKHAWNQHRMEEDWGFLLIDVRNAFNELNRTVMLWTVRHEWPSGERFTINCYKHWSILVIRGNNGTGVFLFSKEGVTQGDPILMVAYGIGVLPLIRQLKKEFPAGNSLGTRTMWEQQVNLTPFGATLSDCNKLDPILGIFPSCRRVLLSCPSATLKQLSWSSPTWVSRSPQVIAVLAVSLVKKMH
jgi:hypothetical protein